MTPPRTPVLVGYGQVNQRDEEPSVEPIDLMAAAARAAADPRVLEAVDSIRVVNILSWRYRDPGRLLADRIRATDASSRYTGVGGNVPQTLVNQACLDIQSGSADLVLIAGAETFRTRTRLRARGTKPAWTSQDESVPFAEGANESVPLVGPAEVRINLVQRWAFLPSVRAGAADRCGGVAGRPSQAYRRIVVEIQRCGTGQPACLDPDTAVGRGDLAAERRQPDDQLALHQADELEQHGRSGRGRHPGRRGEGHPSADPHRALGFPLFGDGRARHVRDRRTRGAAPVAGDQDRRSASPRTGRRRRRRHRPDRRVLLFPVGGPGGRRRTGTAARDAGAVH